MLILGMIMGCGNKNTSSPTLSIVPHYPEMLVQIQDNLESKGILFSSIERARVSDIVDGEKKDDQWHFTWQSDINRQEKYHFVMNIYYRSDGSEDSVLVAMLETDIETLDDAHIDDGSLSYNMSIDSDSDDLLDIEEIIQGLNPFNADADLDGVLDGHDFFPMESTEWMDTDQDGQGDNSDDDIDGDGLLNSDELLMGTNSMIADSDDDSHLDSVDNCPTSSNADQLDQDADGHGDACDDDRDGDGLSDDLELMLGTNISLMDTDGDGLGDGTEENIKTDPLNSDTDGDDHLDSTDNCPLIANAKQLNTDADAEGDACDLDADNDGHDNVIDNCELIVNHHQLDRDDDGLGDLCDEDMDGDGYENTVDNCVYRSNPDQVFIDMDGDSISSACDLDDYDPMLLGESNAIFVSQEYGSDDYNGSRFYPKKTIQSAIQNASSLNLPIVVSAGVYDSDQIIFENNVKLFGGFYESRIASERFMSRHVHDENNAYRTELRYASASEGIVLNADYIRMDGFFITPEISNSMQENHECIVSVNGHDSVVSHNKVHLYNALTDYIGICVNASHAIISHNHLYLDQEDNAITSLIGVQSNQASIIQNNTIAWEDAYHRTGIVFNHDQISAYNNQVDMRSTIDGGIGSGINLLSPQADIRNNIILMNNTLDLFAMKCQLMTRPTDISVTHNRVFIGEGPGVSIAKDCVGHSYSEDINNMQGLISHHNLVIPVSDWVNVLDAGQVKSGIGQIVDHGIMPDQIGYQSQELFLFDMKREQRIFGDSVDIGPFETQQ